MKAYGTFTRNDGEFKTQSRNIKKRVERTFKKRTRVAAKKEINKEVLAAYIYIQRG